MEAAFTVAITAASEGQENAFVPEVVRTSPGDLVEAEQAMCGLLEVRLNNFLIAVNFFFTFLPTY